MKYRFRFFVLLLHCFQTSCYALSIQHPQTIDLEPLLANTSLPANLSAAIQANEFNLAESVQRLLRYLLRSQDRRLSRSSLLRVQLYGPDNAPSNWGSRNVHDFRRITATFTDIFAVPLVSGERPIFWMGNYYDRPNVWRAPQWDGEDWDDTDPSHWLLWSEVMSIMDLDRADRLLKGAGYTRRITSIEIANHGPLAWCFEVDAEQPGYFLVIRIAVHTGEIDEVDEGEC